jgi:NAD(P)-dependent dehydrogenase (short-subunit alcohol dehydrogenase family)
VGEAAAEGLVTRGFQVVIVGRSQAKCEAIVDRLNRGAARPLASSLVADLASQTEVRRLALAFKERHPRLDVLINNAGGIFLKRRETVDGIEQTFALNHLAYFLLTQLLLDRLIASAPSRIVNVSSVGHTLTSGINFEDPQCRRSYRGFPAYYQSKLANIMFTYELARRLQGTAVTVNALHPGLVRTNIGRNNGLVWSLAKPLLDRWLRLR